MSGNKKQKTTPGSATTTTPEPVAPEKKQSPMEKKLAQMVGMTQRDFAEVVGKQVKSLPPARVIPNSAQAIAGQIGWLLYHAEEMRIRGTKKLPMYPLEWKSGKCTGKVLQLGRVTSRTKRASKTDDTMIDNPNFGRFYFARRVPLFNDDGTPKMRSFVAGNGEMMEVQDSALSNFQWLDETPFSKAGVLDELCKNRPVIAELLRSTLDPTTFDPSQDTLWPKALLEWLFLAGHSEEGLISDLNPELVAKKKASPSSSKKRKRANGKEITQHQPESGDEEDDNEEDESEEGSDE